MPPLQHPALQQWLRPVYRRADIRELIQFLTEQGTFRFEPLENGLFPAAVAVDADFAYTGYHHVWVRDNIHVSFAHTVWGQPEIAARAVSALLQWFATQRSRFEAITSGQADAQDPMQRPHIRFQGEDLTESPEKWAHAQNDALGYTLWLASRLIREGFLPGTSEQIATLALFPSYFEAIQFWQDEDSGHWEELRKIEASSIGPVVAGLRELQTLLTIRPELSPSFSSEQLQRLIDHGQQALDAILPAECIQPPPQGRASDAALLFLVFPLEVARPDQAASIVAGVQTDLQGDFGIRRYLGDSYWCADYKTALAPENRSVDFSDDMSARDSLLQPGGEAQWCVFDPIVSIIFARRYLASGDLSDRQQQIAALHRALGQLTSPDCAFGPFRCPESYYREKGTYVPNDVTPLLWTQANLRMALHYAELTAD